MYVHTHIHLCINPHLWSLEKNSKWKLTLVLLTRRKQNDAPSPLTFQRNAWHWDIYTALCQEAKYIFLWVFLLRLTQQPDGT